MGHSLGIKGCQGRLLAGYRTAATLGTFTLTPSDPPGGWHVDASITSKDAYWIAQEAERGLELQIGQQRWRWRSASLEVAGDTVIGTVSGRPERR